MHMRRYKLVLTVIIIIIALFLSAVLLLNSRLFARHFGLLFITDEGNTADTTPDEDNMNTEISGNNNTETDTMDKLTDDLPDADMTVADTADEADLASADSSKNHTITDFPSDSEIIDSSSNNAVIDSYTDKGDNSGTGMKADTEDTSLQVSYQGDNIMFYYEELSQEIKDRITGVSYPVDSKVPYEELRYVKVLYWGFDGEPHPGELIVNKEIAQDIIDIFSELYDHKYPIEQMVLVDEYKADDNSSMAANNTSSFNYRPIDDGSGRLSLHSYGLAIDINPLYNPYVREMNGKQVTSPEEGSRYADRSLDNVYYIKKGDIVYEAFISRGFTWGGDWKNSKDYQHFQKKTD